ncbi:NAD-dependent epimerase/dehydratase family protein [Staphylococcus aureus]
MYIFSNGLQTRDFVYVYDVVQSVRLIIKHDQWTRL